MVNAALLTLGLSTLGSAAVVERNSPPHHMVQLGQTVPKVASTCSKHTTKFTFKNNCDFPVHIWRADSGVDKAAELPRGAEFAEPFRQDWRSGVIGYRISASATGPYDGSGMTVISYIFKQANNYGYMFGQGNHVFQNSFEDHRTVLRVDAGVDCKNTEGKSLSGPDFAFGASFNCGIDLVKYSHFGLSLTFCAE